MTFPKKEWHCKTLSGLPTLTNGKKVSTEVWRTAQSPLSCPGLPANPTGLRLRTELRCDLIPETTLSLSSTTTRTVSMARKSSSVPLVLFPSISHWHWRVCVNSRWWVGDLTNLIQPDHDTPQIQSMWLRMPTNTSSTLAGYHRAYGKSEFWGNITWPIKRKR